MLTFNENEHKYYLNNKELTSVTTYINGFKNKDIYINRYSEDEKESKFKEWNDKLIEASKFGTKVHNLIYDYVKFNICHDDDKLAGDMSPANLYLSYAIDYIKDKKVLYAEEIVYDEKLGLAGTFDIILKDKDEIVLVDWKTSKSIWLDSKHKMKEPYNNLDDCNYNHYGLQLCLYKYMTEKKYDIKIDRMVIAHICEIGLIEYVVSNDFYNKIIKII